MTKDHPNEMINLAPKRLPPIPREEMLQALDLFIECHKQTLDSRDEVRQKDINKWIDESIVLMTPAYSLRDDAIGLTFNSIFTNPAVREYVLDVSFLFFTMWGVPDGILVECCDADAAHALEMVATPSWEETHALGDILVEQQATVGGVPALPHQHHPASTPCDHANSDPKDMIMIERAPDQAETEVVQPSTPNTETRPAVIPDTAKTQEVVEQHDNFEVVSNVAVTLTDTPAVTEDGLRIVPVASTGRGQTSSIVHVDEAATGESAEIASGVSAEVAASPQESVLPIDPSLIGAHDASPRIDPQSATYGTAPAEYQSPMVFIPQLKAVDMSTLPGAEALPTLDNAAPSKQDKGTGLHERREPRAPRGSHPATPEELERLRNFTEVRTENSIRSDNRKRAEQRAQREGGKPQERKPQPPQGKKPQPGQQPRAQQPQQAPKGPVLVRSERTVGYLQAAMRDRDLSLSDGVDHINTTVEAKTELGKMLDTNAFSPFAHPDLGHFNSLSGMWYYVTGAVSDEGFRDLHGSICKRRGESIQVRKVDGIRSIIAEATWFKVMQNKKLRQLMAENVLPYRCYFTRGEGAMRGPRLVDIESWYMPVLQEIGNTMRRFLIEGDENAQPDFGFLQMRDRQDNRHRPHQGGERRDRRA